jgi:hypothetical protein
MMNSSQPVTDPNAPFLNAASLHGPREFAATGPQANRNCSVAITQLQKLEFQSDTVQTPAPFMTYIWTLV